MEKKHVIFMGTPPIAATVLEALLDSDVIVDLVVTQPDKKTGRKQMLVESAVKQVAKRHGIEVFQPVRIKDDCEKVVGTPCDLIVTCAYGQLVPQCVLDHPAFGCVNLHGSLLPAYRGGAPIQRAIMHGDTESGMTLMKMVRKMDAGPVLDVERIAIAPTDTSTSLFLKMGDAAATLLKRNLPVLLSGQAVFVEQDEEKATFAPILTREEEHLDLTSTDDSIVRQIRALSDEPGAYVLVKGRKLKIYDYEYIPADNTTCGLFSQPDKKSLCLELHQGKLHLKMCQLEGKPKMAIRDFINGQGRSLVGETAQ